MSRSRHTLGSASREIRGIVHRVFVPVGPSIQFALFLADDLAEVTEGAIRTAWERWLGPQRFERKLRKLARLGLITTVSGNGNTERVVRLTEAGRVTALGGRDPEHCWRRRWDGRWRLVLFDVPEAQGALRTHLRRKLRTLRFGYLQNSAWISPDPLTTLRAAIATTAIDVETLTFLEARPCGGESDADLVAGAWDFRRINRGYELHGEILKAAPVRWRSSSQARRWMETEWRAWHAAVQHDPLLPETLLPSGYRGREAWLRRKERLTRLLASA